MGFGIKLKALLKEKNMTIKELSDITGISKNTLYSITKRDTRAPRIEIIEKIAAALNIDSEELLSLDDITIEINRTFNKMDREISQIEKILSSHPELIENLTDDEINQIAFLIDFLKHRDLEGAVRKSDAPR